MYHNTPVGTANLLSPNGCAFIWFCLMTLVVPFALSVFFTGSLSLRENAEAASNILQMFLDWGAFLFNACVRMEEAKRRQGKVRQDKAR